MEKKWFVALLMVVVMMYACWTGAVADEERKTFTSGDYEYALLDDGTVEITGYNGKAEKLTIPNMLNVILAPCPVSLNTRPLHRIPVLYKSFFSVCMSLTKH